MNPKELDKKRKELKEELDKTTEEWKTLTDKIYKLQVKQDELELHQMDIQRKIQELNTTLSDDVVIIKRCDRRVW
jgi:chromosome segregation ATPase